HTVLGSTDARGGLHQVDPAKNHRRKHRLALTRRAETRAEGVNRARCYWSGLVAKFLDTVEKVSQTNCRSTVIVPLRELGANSLNDDFSIVSLILAPLGWADFPPTAADFRVIKDGPPSTQSRYSPREKSAASDPSADTAAALRVSRRIGPRVGVPYSLRARVPPATC